LTEESEVFVTATVQVDKWRDSGYQTPEVDEAKTEDDTRREVRMLPGMR
jgi:hypothetical protein